MDNNANLLLQGDAWVSFVYSDNSIKSFRTTLNETLLNSLNIVQAPDSLYDLDREEFVKIPQGVTFKVTSSRPEFARRVDEFVNRFI